MDWGILNSLKVGLAEMNIKLERDLERRLLLSSNDRLKIIIINIYLLKMVYFLATRIEPAKPS